MEGLKGEIGITGGMERRDGEREREKKITDKFHQNYKGYQFALKFVTISFELKTKCN